MDYFLKAASEADLIAALIAAELLIETTVPVIEIIDGVPTQTGVQPGHALATGVALDTIGTIYKPTGQMLTVDGREVPGMAPIEGFHANLLADLSDEQKAALGSVLLTDAPANPYRVWAAMPPVVEQAEEIPVEVVTEEVQP